MRWQSPAHPAPSRTPGRYRTQGDPDAQSGRGNLYLGGYGVAKDEAAAMAWFRKAAEQGSSSGQFSLGSLYYAREDYWLCTVVLTSWQPFG